MKLYIINNYRSKYEGISGRELTDRLISFCLKSCYGDNSLVIKRKGKGKPDVAGEDGEADIDIFLSVSHSGDSFACVIDKNEIGLDIQYEREGKNAVHRDMKVARRFFSEREADMASDIGFYVIWARKEAFAKYTGLGMEEILSKSPVFDRDDVYFTDMVIGEEPKLYISICSEKRAFSEEDFNDEIHFFD